MNKELLNDIGDLLGISMYGIDSLTEICSVCGLLKDNCNRLVVTSVSTKGPRNVTLCKECVRLVWRE